MNKKKLKIVFQNMDDFFNDIKKNIKSKKLSVDDGVIRFENPNAYRKFMTTTRIEILVIINEKKPQSIYHLSKLMDRSFSSVLKDCQILAETGFIKLTKESNGERGSLRPELAYPYEEIDIRFDCGSYKILLIA